MCRRESGLDSHRTQQCAVRMNTDGIIPALCVVVRSLVAGTLQGDLSACGWRAVCARHFSLGKRNLRCKRDSWAGAKEKQEAQLGRRKREQEMSKKEGGTAEILGLEGVSEQGQERKPLWTGLQRKHRRRCHTQSDSGQSVEEHQRLRTEEQQSKRNCC